MEKKESKIRRSSYVRKSYTRKDGTKVKGSIKDQGKIGKGKKLFEIKDKGLLTRNGYSLKKNSKERKTSLRRASKEIGMLPVLRHINAIRTLQKNNPDNFKKLDQDVKFVQKEYKMKNKNK
jgi:hypothetical protein